MAILSNIHLSLKIRLCLIQMIILKDSFQKSNALKTWCKDTTYFQESKQNKQEISISKPKYPFFRYISKPKTLRFRCISKPKIQKAEAFPKYTNYLLLHIHHAFYLNDARKNGKTSNFNKNITHNLLGIHKKMVILQPAIEYKINIKNKEL